MEKEIVTLNDGLEYVIVDEISSNGNVYVYLSNVDNPDKFCIRKKIYNNELHLLVGLDNDEEFDFALKLYSKNI